MLHMNIYTLINGHTCTHKHEWIFEYIYVSFLSEKTHTYIYISWAKFATISLPSVKNV